MELALCAFGSHEVPRSAFTRPGSGVEVFGMCNPWYHPFLDLQENDDNDDDDNNRSVLPSRPSSASSFRAFHRGSTTSALADSDMDMLPSSSVSRSHSCSRAPHTPILALDNTDPYIDPVMQVNDEDAPALSDQDWQYLKDFQERLTKDLREYCSRCKES